MIIPGTRHSINQQKESIIQIKDLDVSKPESVTVTLFLSHRKTQFLMSYWDMQISRFMGVCHSNETKVGLKKIQEQSPGMIYQKMQRSSNNFADISKITKKYCGKMHFALIFPIIDHTFHHHFSVSFVQFLSELHKPLTSKDYPLSGFILLTILSHEFKLLVL